MFETVSCRVLPLLALLCSSVAAPGPPPEKIYWTDPDAHRIFRADLAGSNAETLVQGDNCFSPIGIALDSVRGKIYWTGSVSCAESGIRRANLDGSAVATLPLDVTDPTGIALGGGKIYWIDGAASAGWIRRANLDGSAPEALASTGLYAWDLALDMDAGKIYWTEIGERRVRRASLDGSGAETLIDDTFAIALALDLTRDELYLAAPGTLFRTDLDGTNPEELVEEIGYAQGLALDLARGDAYWTTNLSASGSKVRRSRLDGPPIEDLIVDLNRPKGIALLLASVCGNGVVTPPEECDDGNNVSGDGCGADCTPESGVPAVSPGGALLLALLLLGASSVVLWGRRPQGFQPSSGQLAAEPESVAIMCAVEAREQPGPASIESPGQP